MWSQIALGQNYLKPVDQGLGEIKINSNSWDQGTTINAITHAVLTAINIHVFADCNIIGTCATAYAVTNQPSYVNQYAIASKSWLAKQSL